MKNAYYFFEKYKQLPTILINEKGEYLIDDEAIPKPKIEPVKKVYVKKKRDYIDFDEKDIPSVVNTLPIYPAVMTLSRHY